jgi:hypothetical protein
MYGRACARISALSRGAMWDKSWSGVAVMKVAFEVKDVE